MIQKEKENFLKRNMIDMLREEIQWIIKFSKKPEKPEKSFYEHVKVTWEVTTFQDGLRFG